MVVVLHPWLREHTEQGRYRDQDGEDHQAQQDALQELLNHLCRVPPWATGSVSPLLYSPVAPPIRIAGQSPLVARSQISKPEKKRKKTAVTTIAGSRQPLSLHISGRALRFKTMSITE